MRESNSGILLFVSLAICMVSVKCLNATMRGGMRCENGSVEVKLRQF
jgi:hypothetical protein